MFARPTKALHCLVSAAIVLTLASAWRASPALAKIARNTIDPVAIVSDHGRRIIVTGPIRCDKKQRVALRVTVTQRSTGAVAEGRALFTCVVDGQQWRLRAAKQGKKTFKEGPAIAVAVASTYGAGDADDAQQWLVDITLAQEVAQGHASALWRLPTPLSCSNMTPKLHLRC
ncbi:MAG TPA: hypothetical protein VIV27_06570 [Halioglobus sp.]